MRPFGRTPLSYDEQLAAYVMFQSPFEECVPSDSAGPNCPQGRRGRPTCFNPLSRNVSLRTYVRRDNGYQVYELVSIPFRGMRPFGPTMKITSFERTTGMFQSPFEECVPSDVREYFTEENMAGMVSIPFRGMRPFGQMRVPRPTICW